jgi:hypothetical protein
MVSYKDGTGGGVVEFFDYLADKGLMNRSTAAARKSAAIKVLETEDDWKDVDLRSIDIDEQVHRFHTLSKTMYRPNTLSTYESRFRSAVEEYLKYLDDPAAYKSPTASRRSSKRQPVTASASGDDASCGGDAAGATRSHVASGPVPAPPPREQLITYPFPLREGVMAYVQLPSDFRSKEAERMARFLTSVAFEPTEED